MDSSALVGLFGMLALIALVALRLAVTRKVRSEDEARAYLAGFKYVLSDDPDAAIAELSRVALLSGQTLETYFALGALFRRKGELDRALRLHQNILLRPGLSQDVRRRAQLELGLDYKSSGLFGRAAEVFEKLLSDEPGNREALVQYRQVLEGTKEWGRAIEVQSRLVKLEKKGEDVLAHLLAAAARSLLGVSKEEAEAFAARGVALAPSSADALLALGEARLALGRAEDAERAIKQALELEPELAPKAVALLSACVPRVSDVETYLSEQLSSRGDEGAPFALALALHCRSLGNSNRAIGLLKNLVERRPRFWEARRELGALLLEHDRSEDLRADYQEILGALGEPAMDFACQSCQQKLPEMVFRCPSCEGWDTVHRAEAPRSVI